MMFLMIFLSPDKVSFIFSMLTSYTPEGFFNPPPFAFPLSLFAL